MPDLAKFPLPIFRLLAWLALAVAGPGARAQQVRVFPGIAFVLPGEPVTFTASRAGPAVQWQWSINGESKGFEINPVSGQVRAPLHGASGTEVVIQATDPNAPGATGRGRLILTHKMINAQAGNRVLESGGETRLGAYRAGPEHVRWRWRLLDPALGGEILDSTPDLRFRPGLVAYATTFCLQVQDLEHPADTDILGILVVPKMILVSKPADQSQAVAPQLILAAGRADRRPCSFSWQALADNGGHFEDLGQGRVRYSPPRVAVPTWVPVRVTCEGPFARRFQILAEPRIKLSTSSSTHVLSGNTCTVKASLPAGANGDAPLSWTWQAEGLPENAQLVREPNPDQLAPKRKPHQDELNPKPEPIEAWFSFKAPEVDRPTRFQLQVTDSLHPDDPARIRIDVLPRLPGLEPGTESVFQKLMPKLMGADWLAPVPAMRLLAQPQSSAAQVQPSARFRDIQCIRYVEADPAMGWLSRKWLVGDRNGIKVVSCLGEVTPLPGVFDEVTAIAIRPRGSAPGFPDRLAFACRTPGRPQSMVCLLRDNQTPVPLAGSLEPRPEAAALQVGRGHRVGFGQIKGLAWAEDGGLRVVDLDRRKCRDRRIAPDGLVTMAESRLNAPAALDPAGSHLPAALAWNPADRAWFCAYGSAIWKADARTLEQQLGAHQHPGFQDEDGRCLNQPEGLDLNGPYLFIADTRNMAMRVFNMESKRLLTLAGSPQEAESRPGPLAFGSPDLSPHLCAALSLPRVFAVNAEGDCLLAQGDKLMHLDLSAYAVAPPDAEEEAAGVRMADEDPPAAGSDAAAAGAQSMAAEAPPAAGHGAAVAGPVPMEIDPPEPAGSSAAAAASAGPSGHKRKPDGEHEDAHRPPPPPPAPPE